MGEHGVVTPARKKTSQSRVAHGRRAQTLRPRWVRPVGTAAGLIIGMSMISRPAAPPTRSVRDSSRAPRRPPRRRRRLPRRRRPVRSRPSLGQSQWLRRPDRATRRRSYPPERRRPCRRCRPSSRPRSRPDPRRAARAAPRSGRRPDAPGEISGPAVRVRVKITNTSGTALDLDRSTVAVTNAAKSPLSPVQSDPAGALRGSLASANSAEGTYIFSTADSRGPLSILVSAAAGTPAAQFVGEPA